MSIVKRPNRLASETSPYLLQHAHNPVDWYPWGDEAFAKARTEGKPLFLSIGYSSCHWCHVMERESFENEATAALLNGGFVAVKVDREERPDVDDVYMSAVQAMGTRGGWPLSAFLLPDARPFFGGTFPRPTLAGGSASRPSCRAFWRRGETRDRSSRREPPGLPKRWRRRGRSRSGSGGRRLARSFSRT